MSAQGIATSLLLPPLLLVLVALGGGLAVFRRARCAGAVTAAAMALVLLLATPFVAGHLRASLEHGLPVSATEPAGAIVVLGGEVARATDHVEVGPLTLERMRTAAALHRRTGLPLLVTGGTLGPGDPPVAVLMAQGLETAFGAPVRWIEPAARDTRDNAVLSAALLRREGIGTVHVVTHAWHMRRALAAFARAGLVAIPAPVRIDRVPDGGAADWIPRPDRLAVSWFALREWAGILVYRLRDGAAPPGQE